MRCTLALTHVIKMMGRMFMRLTYFTITNNITILCDTILLYCVILGAAMS